jgi:hypothetical protein
MRGSDVLNWQTTCLVSRGVALAGIAASLFRQSCASLSAGLGISHVTSMACGMLASRETQKHVV